jgi:uncharacterized protein DUF1569
MDFLLQRIQSAIISATRGMSAEQLKWHPESKWSAAEILEHLSLTYRGTRIGCERCLQAEKPPTAAPTLKERLSRIVVVNLSYMPKGRQAPPRSHPKGAPAENIVASVQEQIESMDEAICKCEERFGGRVRLINHPFLGPLTAPEWRKFHWVHARHHMRQIRWLKNVMPGNVSRQQNP